jgi:hypothetical protein
VNHSEDEWKTYRTRFLVRAKPLHGPLRFVDALGREHKGEKGDYLIESSDGLLRIAPRRIFEDIYVPLEPDNSTVGRPEPEIPPRRVLHGERLRQMGAS